MRGRPTKFDSIRAARVIEFIEKGASRQAAARGAGIAERTLYLWQRKYAYFAVSIKKAESQAELDMIRFIKSQAPKHWQAAAWWLERRHPESWGRRVAFRASVSVETQLEASAVCADVRQVDAIYGLDGPGTALTEPEARG